MNKDNAYEILASAVTKMLVAKGIIREDIQQLDLPNLLMTIEDVINLECGKDEKGELLTVTSPHFHNRTVPITMALRSIASQENCDSEEYDLMYRAADVIDKLADRIREVHSWALCYPISTAEDFAQNAPRIIQITDLSK